MKLLLLGTDRGTTRSVSFFSADVNADKLQDDCLGPSTPDLQKARDFIRNYCKSHRTFVIILAKVIGLLEALCLGK